MKYQDRKGNGIKRKAIKIFQCLLLFSSPLFSPLIADEIPAPSQQALQQLLDGNMRYTSGKPIHPNQDIEKRQELAAGQKPIAVIIGCSDSRVPPELVFDQGLGDIFVVRVAGNVVGPVELDSIEFAVDQLKTPLIIVLGHQECGAVKSVIMNDVPPDEINDLTTYILPAVEKAKLEKGDLITNAVKENVKLIVTSLKKNPLLARLEKENKMYIVGAYYNLDTGAVSLL